MCVAGGVIVASQFAALVRFCSSGIEWANKIINGLHREELGWGNQAEKMDQGRVTPWISPVAHDWFFSTTESSGDRWMAFLFRILWPLISLCFLGRIIWLWRKIHSCTLHIIARSECLGSGSRLFKSWLHHTSCVNLGKLLNLCLICQMKKLGSYLIGLWWRLNQNKKSKELNVVADTWWVLKSQDYYCPHQYYYPQELFLPKMKRIQKASITPDVWKACDMTLGEICHLPGPHSLSVKWSYLLFYIIRFYLFTEKV